MVESSGTRRRRSREQRERSFLGLGQALGAAFRGREGGTSGRNATSRFRGAATTASSAPVASKASQPSAHEGRVESRAARMEARGKAKTSQPSAHEGRVESRAARMEARGSARSESKPKPKAKAKTPSTTSKSTRPSTKETAADRKAERRAKAIVSGTKSANKMANAKFDRAKKRAKKRTSNADKSRKLWLGHSF